MDATVQSCNICATSTDGDGADIAMTEFLTSLLVFIASHVLPARTGLRAWAVGRIGHGPYMAAYSVVSLAIVVWIVVAAGRAPYVELWPQASWQAWAPLLVMPFALVLLTAGLVQPNPLSIGLMRADRPDTTVGIMRVTRHPVLWGFGLWAFAHVVTNGDLVSVILFGGLGLFAFAGMAALDRRRRREMGDDPWADRVRETTAVPFGAIVTGRTLAAAALGIAVYLALLLGGHVLLFGTDPLAAL
jgi:uncharacterized membrane protein